MIPGVRRTLLAYFRPGMGVVEQRLWRFCAKSPDERELNYPGAQRNAILPPRDAYPTRHR